MERTGTNKKEKGQVGHDLASLRKLIADRQIQPPNLFPGFRSWGYYLLLLLRTTT
jgi:hypothetical protein